VVKFTADFSHISGQATVVVIPDGWLDCLHCTFRAPLHLQPLTFSPAGNSPNTHSLPSPPVPSPFPMAAQPAGCQWILRTLQMPNRVVQILRGCFILHSLK
jgi:hypothetical protein